MSATKRDEVSVAVQAALTRPFDPKEIKWKPQMVKNNRAMAMAYIDARLIQDRLDEVMGVENWKDEYQVLPDGSVQCLLSLRFGAEWVTKQDVGSLSEQPDGGDRLKAAFSDSLKRCAVKFGIGRYLYRLPAQWVDYDPVKKQLCSVPQLPAFAIPQAEKKIVPPQGGSGTAPPGKDPPKENAVTVSGQPKNGEELDRRLRSYDAKLNAEKLCPPGALISHVVCEGVKAGFPAALTDWNETAAIQFGVATAIAFDKKVRSGKAA